MRSEEELEEMLSSIQDELDNEVKSQCSIKRIRELEFGKSLLNWTLERSNTVDIDKE